MSLAFHGQTQQQQQQQQQVKDEQSTEKTVDDDQLQKPLKVRHYYTYILYFMCMLYNCLEWYK